MMTPNNIAAALGGRVVDRDSVLAPGPGHSAKDRSLSVKLTSDGDVIVHSFAGDDWQMCRDYVLDRLGMDAVRARPSLKVIQQPASSDRSELALTIWREAKSIRGTPAERYLASRGIALPDDGDGLRFHPNCPFGQDRHPCMIGLYRHILTNEPRAIHRTALTANGTKIDRKALGPKRGCAIKLTPDEHVETGLTIGEGIETALAE